jgi:hypothetical protein
MVRAVPCRILENCIVPGMPVHFGRYFSHWVNDRNRLLANPKSWPLCSPDKCVVVLDLGSLIPSPVDFLLIHLDHHFVLVIVGRPHVSLALEEQFLFQILSAEFGIG